MDVSSVQKTRLTFTLVSTPMLLVQHEIIPNTLFQNWVADALQQWHWCKTPLLLTPVTGILFTHALRAHSEQHRYKPGLLSPNIQIEYEKIDHKLMSYVEEGIDQYSSLLTLNIYNRHEKIILQFMKNISLNAKNELIKIQNNSPKIKFNKIIGFGYLFIEQLNHMLKQLDTRINLAGLRL